MCLTVSPSLCFSLSLPLKLIINNYIAGVVAVLRVVPFLRLDDALGADTGGGRGSGLVTGGVVTGGGRGRGLVIGGVVTGGGRGRGLVIGGGSGHVTGGRRGRGLVIVGGSGPVTGGGRGAGDALLSLDSTTLSPVPAVLSQGILK